jgi:osmotically-inducible protein OsmY
MKNNLKLSAIAAALLAITAVGCADMKITPAGPVPETRIQNPDNVLAERVRDELRMKPRLEATQLKVAARNGEVTLSGDVKTGRQLADIAKFVQALPGVTAVIPDINVKP